MCWCRLVSVVFSFKFFYFFSLILLIYSRQERCWLNDLVNCCLPPGVKKKNPTNNAFGHFKHEYWTYLHTGWKKWKFWMEVVTQDANKDVYQCQLWKDLLRAVHLCLYHSEQMLITDLHRTNVFFYKFKSQVLLKYPRQRWPKPVNRRLIFL